ncbi:N-acetyltransferase [Schaalia sp. JY-X159]|jgi:ribosomal protein S18 acetylase RimI-like enzyme|uniref:GNAT family N-acetyltransferase n=1 Tax=Schaalia sp. JY-X159 TaxID=2758575 RepID=UPI00165D6167|nr:GNAT family N-acetyltransferase [Schaalia sp. JY-X159]
MTVDLITDVTPELVEAFEKLIPQLSSSAKPMGKKALKKFVAQPGVFLFTYRAVPTGEAPVPGLDPILGMLTLVTFQIPTGKRAWIEDVVVDNGARGQGAGQALVEAALDQAKVLGCVSVDLTSRPSREAANRLYVRCGFQTRETNIYRYVE